MPLCVDCAACVVHKRAKDSPMVLANDNWWGYTSCLLWKYQVTWLEAAIVQPCWTSMLVCYVEGDEGHLLGEKCNNKRIEPGCAARHTAFTCRGKIYWKNCTRIVPRTLVPWNHCPGVRSV